MIRLSTRARSGYARLFRAYNDVDVYVEDSTYVGVYERLLNRALAGRAKVERVTPLGPREVVVSRALEDQSTDGRPRLYIVDGDLDLIARQRMKSARHLYRLKVYSIENVLFDELAVKRYCCFAIPGKTEADAIAAPDIDGIIGDVNGSIALYVLVLGIARRLDLRNSLLSFNSTQIFVVKGGSLASVDKRKILGRVRQIVKYIVGQVGHEKYRVARLAVEKNIKYKKLSGVQYSPGKIFLIWFLNKRIGQAGGLSHGQQTVVSYLADYCTFSSEPALLRRMRQLVPPPPRA